jgi:alkanesulfonate monooxygenase SsuD/methylene tetrahydromethanopterin reductase-like flavin-dependent oxidoreductase (luciferase family)
VADRGPFAAGSISVGLSAVGDSGRSIVARLVADANAAVDAGFDGVTLSEHHGGLPRYVPCPLLLAGVLLGQMTNGWASAGPAILPLRTAVTVAEDLAWLASAYPGRVGAGFVAGYQRSDFTVVGADFAVRRPAFWTGLGELVTALGMTDGSSPIDGDPALADLGRGGLPLLAGVGGPLGARRAARTGVGMLVTGLRPPAEVAELQAAYAAEGGAAPTVLIRHVQLDGSDGFATNLANWTARSDAPAWLAPADSALVAGTPDEVAAALVAAVRTSGCAALNLRLTSYATDPDRATEQVSALGAHVLPRVRAELGWPTSEDG